MRNKIAGAIGVLLGIYICLPMFLSSEPVPFPWAGFLMIGLGVWYLFKAPPLEDTPDIDPADRVRNMDETKSD